MAYSEFDACVGAGLDLARWEGEGTDKPYSKNFKILVMAWHRASKLIRANVEQAVADKSRKK